MDALVELPGDRLVLGGGEVLLRRPTDRRAVAQGRAGPAGVSNACALTRQCIQFRRDDGTHACASPMEGTSCATGRALDCEEADGGASTKSHASRLARGEVFDTTNFVSEVTVPSSESFCHINK